MRESRDSKYNPGILYQQNLGLFLDTWIPGFKLKTAMFIYRIDKKTWDREELKNVAIKYNKLSLYQM